MTAWRTLTPVERPAVTADCPHFLPGGHSRPGLESPCLTSRSAYPATCLATRQGAQLGLRPAVQGRAGGQPGLGHRAEP